MRPCINTCLRAWSTVVAFGLRVARHCDHIPSPLVDR